MTSANIAHALPLLSWFKLVNDTVPEPYMDEQFHVKQAQIYCNGNLRYHDPKITTPPGLYLISYLFSPLLGCSLTTLRGLNLFALATIILLVIQIFRVRRGGEESAVSRHNALNIALLPPLFFVSALYYTDVVSTLSVLLVYWLFLLADQRQWTPVQRTSTMLVLGLASLMLRQTNIFWISIFPAGLVLIKQLDRGHKVVKQSMYRKAEGFGDSIVSVARTSYKMEVIYDLPVADASIEDYLKTIVSIACCTVKLATDLQRVPAILRDLMPYLSLLFLFSCFVLWNGGVVLGDKSNHIATLHLPQMLYIWPYFVFFSWPLVYPYLLLAPTWLAAKLPVLVNLDSFIIFRRRQLLPRALVVGTAIASALTVVFFNTIVHPFTLSDNRHYTFYVFRLLTRPYWVKYVVTPIYIVCGWACIQALGSKPPAKPSNSAPQSKDAGGSNGEVNSKAVPIPDGTAPANTSFVLVWLATSTLQLITAPLVEPRYFILPWIFWRMHLPLQFAKSTHESKSTSWTAKIKNLDHRLVLETIWLVCINAVTGYIFLYRDFSWAQEPGTKQRFMW